MQTIINLGTGGADLNGQNGSTTSADSNDALFLDWPGDNLGNYLYLPGNNQGWLTVPDEAALDITGDIDIRVYVAADDWTPGASRQMLSKWTATGDNRSYALLIAASNVLTLNWSDLGTAASIRSASSTIAPTVTDGSPLWVRATLDVDNGASGRDIKFFTSTDGSTWTQLGTTVTQATVTSIYSSTAEVQVGGFSVGLAGKYYRAQIFNGIDGTKVLDVDTSVITTGAATSFTAVTGQTVTVIRATSGRKSVGVVSPVWLFGTDDYMEVAANALLGANPSQDFTVMIIHRIWDTPASSGTKLSTTVAGSGAGRVGFNVRHLTTTYQSQSYWQDATNAPVDTLDAALAPSAGNLSVMGFIVNRAEQRVRGFSELGIDSGGADISSVGSTVTSNAFRVGRASMSGTAYNDMEVIGVAIFRRALSASEITQIATYYQNKAA